MLIAINMVLFGLLGATIMDSITKRKVTITALVIFIIFILLEGGLIIWYKSLNEAFDKEQSGELSYYGDLMIKECQKLGGENATQFAWQDCSSLPSESAYGGRSDRDTCYFCFGRALRFRGDEEIAQQACNRIEDISLRNMCGF